MTSRQRSIIDRVSLRLRLKHLRLLISVGAHRSILHAARELNMSQSSATKMIRELELDFEVPLFERTNRGMIPTPYGDTLIRHGKLVFAQMSTATQELDDMQRGQSGRVVVGTLLAASSRILPLAVARTLAERPGTSIKIVEATNEILMPQLRSGEVDIVVGRLPTHRHRTELGQQVLYDEPVLAIARPGHPLAGRAGLVLDDLKPFGWILPPPDTTLRRQLDQLFTGGDQFFPRPMVESISYLTNRRLVQSSDLVSVVPGDVATSDISSGAVTRLDWTIPIGAGRVGVTYRQTAPMAPAVALFVKELQALAKAE